MYVLAIGIVYLETSVIIFLTGTAVKNTQDYQLPYFSGVW